MKSMRASVTAVRRLRMNSSSWPSSSASESCDGAGGVVCLSVDLDWVIVPPWRSGAVWGGGHAEVRGCSPAGPLVELAEFLLGGGEADLQALDFAEPALPLGFVDAGEQVVADLGDAVPLLRVHPEQAASQTAVLVNTAGRIRPAAGSQGDAAAFEVAEEFLPYLVSGQPVFFGRPQAAAAGDERAVAVDDFLGVDGLVAHGGVDAGVSHEELADVRWHPVHDGVGGKEPSQVVGAEDHGPAAGVGDA